MQAKVTGAAERWFRFYRLKSANKQGTFMPFNARFRSSGVDAKGSYCIVPNSRRGGWDVKRDGAGRSSGHFSRKTDAVAHGRKLALAGGTELVDRDLGATPQGYGALKGRFAIRPGIDVTKPIFHQARKASRRK